MPLPHLFGMVLAKIETVPGTDAVPTGSDAFMVFDPVVQVQTDNKEKKRAYADRSAQSVRIGPRSAGVSFSLEMKGAGSAALPRWERLLRACGMKAASTTLTPDTVGCPTLTLYVYYGTIRHVLTGCVGTFTLNARAGDTATLNFSFIGTYAEPTIETLPTPTFENVNGIPPIVQNAAFALAGTSYCIEEFTMDMGNETKMLSSATALSGYRGARITDRKVMCGINPEVDLDQTFWNDLTEETLLTFSVQIGVVSGNRLLIEADFSQITSIGYSNRDGLRTFDLEVAFCRGPAGDDEFSLLFD